MRTLVICLVLLIGGLAALILYEPPKTEVSHTTEARIKSGSFRWQTAETPAPETEDNDAGIRPISPDQFAAPFTRDSSGLERIAPRAPATTAMESETQDAGPGRTPLFRPKVVAAGLIRYDQGTLQLQGIDLVLPGDMCTAPDGSHWPCGVIARTAFRNFLRGRALSCVTPGDSWDDTLVTDCVINKQDPAAWLAGHGWAKPKPGAGAAYEDMARLARQQQRGIYGADPRKEMPDIDSRVSVTLVPGEAPEAVEFVE
ncbi:thermonuclease family protein [Hoeflea sp. WL0058]|uniref:Thermonuclease family protein n=1 Tax=Flavimaribacter sediminis TaxID=2865987 RepID=A0AAE2ZN69_9HYPH|nr:thermonuclease family protein [Flavimaribacter sediminis]MBW8637677.1 thermonuclease family protein [Flavimaribacter sediminis]